MTQSARQRPASFRALRKAKTAAASSPTAAATTTEPEPPKTGITTARAAQPNPAPNRSKAYRRLICCVPRVKSKARAKPEQKNGTEMMM